MSLQHAILGLLSIQPMTGYDLKQQAFASTVAHFWQADQAQIYRTLRSLHEGGMVAYTIEYQDERPNRKVYRVTDEGRAELHRWLETEQPLPVHREPFLVQLFFGAGLDNATLLRHIAAQRAAHEAVLAAYSDIPLPQPDSPPPAGDARSAAGPGPRISAREHALWGLTLEMGVRLEQMTIDWLDRCQRVIEALPES
jgi:PadR family transcriptional regulator, regulatory protein AphA